MPDPSHEPKLTVIMAVHNGSLYLRTAIESVLNQTYTDFRFLIIDDASTDGTQDIVRSYKDNRIDLECLGENVGQTAALNIGLKLAKTPWIGRLDADDYSAPVRFEEQMRALEANTEITCIGTHVWMFRDDPEVIDSVFATPERHADIKHSLLRGSPMVHGSIVADREALLDIGGFDERYRFVADLEMYDRLVLKYKTANLPMQLVGIRQHADQTSGTKSAFGEAIDICNGRLLTNNYSRSDISIIKSTLSRVYLYRAQISGDGNNFLDRLKDLGQAIRISPNTFVWNLFVVIFFSRFSEQRQDALRRVLTKYVPKFLTGR